jgi:hypothetical protein
MIHILKMSLSQAPFVSILNLEEVRDLAGLEISATVEKFHLITSFTRLMYRGNLGAGSRNWTKIRINVGEILFKEIPLTENGSLMDWKRNPTRRQILENRNAISDFVASSWRAVNTSPAPPPPPPPPPPPALPSAGMPELTLPFTPKFTPIRPPSFEPDLFQPFDLVWNQSQDWDETGYPDYEFDFPDWK